jgi:pimeloyl-ACP methyl ester carboxylesterase
MPLKVAEEPRARTIALPGRGGEMAALEFGRADRPVDVVFSHANGFNARTYRTVLGPLADRMRILAVDMRGHGSSRLPTGTEGLRSWAPYVDDLLALLRTLDLKDVVLSGHSLGGAASLLAAAQAPDRVRSLQLFDPVIVSRESYRAYADGTAPEVGLVAGASKRRAVFPSRQAVFESYQGRGAFKTWPDEILRDYIQGGFRERDDGEVELACAPAFEAWSFTAQLNDCWGAFHATACPIRILRAETGSTCRVDDALDELAATGRIEVETVAGTTHFIPMERPDLVREVLTAAVA